jgi:acyl-CoA dehydrogenase
MLSDEQALIFQTAERLGQRVGREYWLRCAREGRDASRVWEEMLKAGLTGVGVNPSAGGVGYGLLEAALVQEGLAKAGIPLLQFLTTHLSREILVRYGSREQVNRYVEPTCKEGRRISFALTEPAAGSNTWRISTFARRKSDGYVLNGQKTYITGARESDYMLVVARTRKYEEVENKSKGLSLFILETKTSGISFEPLNIQLHSPETQYTVYFEDVELGAESLVGVDGEGATYLFDGLNVERVLIAACSIGLGEHVLRKAAEYAKQRVVFDKPIGSYQGIQFRMAKAYIHLEAARQLNYEAARTYDAGRHAGALANMAKFAAAEAGLEAFEIALQAFGGSGFDLDTDIITFYPVIRLFTTAPVTNELVLSYVGRHVLGLPKSY